MKIKTFLHNRFNLLALALCLVAGAGCTKAAKARRVLAAADRDYKAQKYDEAEIEYLMALNLSPLNPAAIRHLGFIYCDEGRAAQAGLFLRKALEQDPTNAEVQLDLAEIYSGSRKTGEAAALLGSVLQSQPTNAQAMLLLTQVSGSNELSSAHQKLESLLRQGGQAAAAACHSALGFVDLRMDKTNDAHAEFQKALALNPKLASPYQGEAALCIESRDNKGAEAALKMASDLSPIRSPARLKYVDFRLQAGAVEDAKKLLHEMTREAPDFIPAWLYLMRLSFAEHKYDDCKDAIGRILARDSSNFDALLQLGTLDLAQHEVGKALDTFQHMDEMYKNVKEIKYYLGMAYLLNNEKQKAVTELKDALALDRDYAQAVLMLAQIDLRSGLQSEAVSLLLQLIKNHPENANAQLALAEAYLAQDQPERALAVYQRMTQRFSNEPEIPIRMGEVFENQKNFTQARAAFMKALSLSPDNMSALQQIVGLDINEKRFAEAKYESAGVPIPAIQAADFEKDFAEAHRLIGAEMEKTPKAAEPVLLQGDLYLSETHTNLAEAAYTKAIELNPELPLGYLSLARLYVASHQDQQAIQRLNILAAKTNQVATMMIGEIHQAAGRYPQARDAYESLLSHWPKTALAMNNLAYIDAEYLGQIDRAFQLAQAALQLRPYDPYIADTLGWVLYKKHEYAHALTLIQESVDRNPSPDPEVLMHLGMAYYMMEEEGLARVYLQRSLAGSGDYPGKQAVRHRLEVLDINPTNATPTVFRELQALMHDDPLDPVPLSRLASIQAQRGDIDAAISSLQDLLAINNQVWPAMIRLSRLYAGQKHDLRKALALAKSAHVLVPDDAGVCAWLGELIFRSGADYPWALSLLQQADGQSLHDPSLDYDLASAYYAVGRAREADQAMQRALRQNDSSSDLEEARQFVAMREAVNDPGRAQASRPLAKQILAEDPNYVPALMVIALLEDRSGARDEALKTYDKVLSIYPNFAPAMADMAAIYSQGENKRDLERAYDLAERARSTLPDDPELAKTAGLLAFRLADYNRSVILLLEAAEKSRNDGEVYYYLGMDYYKLNQPRQSRQSLQRALTLRLSQTSETQARRVLSELK